MIFVLFNKDAPDARKKKNYPDFFPIAVVFPAKDQALPAGFTKFDSSEEHNEFMAELRANGEFDSLKETRPEKADNLLKISLTEKVEALWESANGDNTKLDALILARAAKIDELKGKR